MVSLLKSHWNQLKGKAEIQWGKLTHDDWLYVHGERERLIGKIQEYYNVTDEQAASDIDRFIAIHMKENAE